MATTLYMTTYDVEFSRGVDLGSLAVPLLASTVRGLENESRAKSTEAGPTAGINPAYAEYLTKPLAAGVTISGTISLNVWGYESAAGANALWRLVVERIDSEGQFVSTIIDQDAAAEMGTTMAAHSVSGTPTSTSVLAGERLAIRILADDAGTMGSGETVYYAANSPTASVQGDTYVTFTETLTFASEPAGTVIYLTDEASDVSTSDVDKRAWTQNGSGDKTTVTQTVAGYTDPVQCKIGASGVSWWTPPLEAFTLSGAVRCHVTQSSEVPYPRTCVGVEVAVADADGSNPVVWGRGTRWIGDGEVRDPVEFIISGPDTAVADGKRLRIRQYLDDGARYGFMDTAGETQPMAAAYDITTHYDGTDDNPFGSVLAGLHDGQDLGYQSNSVAISRDGTVVALTNLDYSTTVAGIVTLCHGTAWASRTTKQPSDSEANDSFGWCTALSEDGTVLVVGAPHKTDTYTGEGKVYVFSGTNWGTQTIIDAPNAQLNGNFGFAVDVSADGSVILVGAPGETSGGQGSYGAGGGRAYVFHGTNWSLRADLNPWGFDPESGDSMGESVAISGDGSTCVVGSPLWSNYETSQGTVFWFNGDYWTDQHFVYNVADEVPNQYLGGGVAVNYDGSVICGAAPGDSSSSGSLYVWHDRDDFTETYTETKLRATINYASDQMGYNNKGVAISDDGSVIAAFRVDAGNESGAVSVFYGTDWASERKVKDPFGKGYRNYAGYYIDMNGDGTRLVMPNGGAIYDASNGVPGYRRSLNSATSTDHLGGAYVFGPSTGGLAQLTFSQTIAENGDISTPVFFGSKL